VKKEGVRVGLKYGVASEWTGFVAVVKREDDVWQERETTPGTGTDPVVYLPAPSKKRHIRKLENFTNPKDRDKFKRQEFLYYKEFRDDFADDTACIQFDLSFFTGGLPEKFMANFVDQRMSEIVPNYPSYNQFKGQCDTAFQDTNKKTNAENQLMLLKQGSKTAEEFFQEFDQLKFTAGYTDRYHEDVLIKLLHDAIRNTTTDHIYTQHPLPANYQGWKTQILAIDGLQRHRAEQRKSQAHFTVNKPVQQKGYALDAVGRDTCPETARQKELRFGQSSSKRMTRNRRIFKRLSSDRGTAE
jgi:hypothetical protein